MRCPPGPLPKPTDKMDWQLEMILVGRMLGATILGALIGWERERHGTDAGIRTHMAVALGACLFSLISSHIPGADPSRIASQVVVGIGFIGAGVIMQQRGQIAGLTTAAALWATAAMAMAVAYGMYLLATASALSLYAVLALQHLKTWDRLMNKPGDPDHKRPQQ